MYNNLIAQYYYTYIERTDFCGMDYYMDDGNSDSDDKEGGDEEDDEDEEGGEGDGDECETKENGVSDSTSLITSPSYTLVLEHTRTNSLTSTQLKHAIQPILDMLNTIRDNQTIKSSGSLYNALCEFKKFHNM